MLLDISNEVEKLVEEKNRNKKDEDKIKINRDLEKAVENIEDAIKTFDTHYNFGELENELRKIEVDSGKIKGYIQDKVEEIVKY